MVGCYQQQPVLKIPALYVIRIRYQSALLNALTHAHLVHVGGCCEYLYYLEDPHSQGARREST